MLAVGFIVVGIGAAAMLSGRLAQAGKLLGVACLACWAVEPPEKTEATAIDSMPPEERRVFESIAKTYIVKRGGESLRGSLIKD